MKKKLQRFLFVGAVAGFGVLAGARVASAQERPSGTISPRLMTALERWADPVANYEILALEAHPEVIEEYVAEIERTLGGRTFAEYVATTFPGSDAAYLEATGEVATNQADLLAFIMSSQETDYLALQADLAKNKLQFAEFVEARFPDLVAELERVNTPPAAQGVPLLAYLAQGENPDLVDEGKRLLESVDRGGGCSCWTVFAFPEAPAAQEVEIDDHYHHEWGFFNMLVRHYDYRVESKGVARNLDFYRWYEHTQKSDQQVKQTNSSSMRVRMQCTEGGVPGGVACTGKTCSGELVARIGYASRVAESIFASGIWSRQSRQMTADLIKITYDPAGPAPATEIASKGVAVAGDEVTSWDPTAIANAIFGIAQVVVAFASSNSSSALSASLVNDTVQGIAGIISHKGQGGEFGQDMAVAWDNSSSTPILLTTNGTHRFDLEAMSNVYGRGYGSTSKGWSELDSSYYVVAVERNYQCMGNTTAPAPRAHWLYGRAGQAPYSAATLQSQVGSFVATELGVYPPNLSNEQGQYP